MDMNQEAIIKHLETLQDHIFQKTSQLKQILQDEDEWLSYQISQTKSTSTQLSYPKFDKRVCYYQECQKIYLNNQILISKIKSYQTTNRFISKEIDQLEEMKRQFSGMISYKRKTINRRTSSMIERFYFCPFPNCYKRYCSDVSLNSHMKLKHKSGTKTQREALARKICLAEEQGKTVYWHLNFPPGYMWEFRDNFYKQKHEGKKKAVTKKYNQNN